MGSCQNYGPFLVSLNDRCRIIIGTQKGDNHPYRSLRGTPKGIPMDAYGSLQGSLGGIPRDPLQVPLRETSGFHGGGGLYKA